MKRVPILSKAFVMKLIVFCCGATGVKVLAKSKETIAPKMIDLSQLNFMKRPVEESYRASLLGIAVKTESPWLQNQGGLSSAEAIDLSTWRTLKESADELRIRNAQEYTVALLGKDEKLTETRRSFVFAFQTGLSSNQPITREATHQAQEILASKLLQQIALEHVALLLLGKEMAGLKVCSEISRTILFLAHVTQNESAENGLGLFPEKNLLLIALIHHIFVEKSGETRLHPCSGKIPAHVRLTYKEGIMNKYAATQWGYLLSVGGGGSYLRGRNRFYSASHEYPALLRGASTDGKRAIALRLNVLEDTWRRTKNLFPLSAEFGKAFFEEDEKISMNTDEFLGEYAERALAVLR